MTTRMIAIAIPVCDIHAVIILVNLIYKISYLYMHIYLNII